MHVHVLYYWGAPKLCQAMPFVLPMWYHSEICKAHCESYRLVIKDSACYIELVRKSHHQSQEPAIASFMAPVCALTLKKLSPGTHLQTLLYKK